MRKEEEVEVSEHFPKEQVVTAHPAHRGGYCTQQSS